MQMRRLTRLTNGFSKKWGNLKAAYALHFAYYNFCRIPCSFPFLACGLALRILPETLPAESIARYLAPVDRTTFDSLTVFGPALYHPR